MENFDVSPNQFQCSVKYQNARPHVMKSNSGNGHSVYCYRPCSRPNYSELSLYSTRFSSVALPSRLGLRWLCIGVINYTFHPDSGSHWVCISFATPMRTQHQVKYTENNFHYPMQTHRKPNTTSMQKKRFCY